MALENLFEQTEGLHIMGERLGGEAEILYEIEEQFRRQDEWAYPIIRNQIKGILEMVPGVFPIDWVSPEGFDEMTEDQQKAYWNIHDKGPYAVPGPIIARVISLAVAYRDKFPNKDAVS